MEQQLLIERIKEIILPVLDEGGIDLVEFGLVISAGGTIIKLLVDKKESGINIQECADLNHRIGAIIDSQDIINNRYILEVSSPGLDRPLKTKSDFSRCLNKEARFFLNEAINGKLELEAKIVKAEDDAVHMEAEGQLVVVPFFKINRAKLII